MVSYEFQAITEVDSALRWFLSNDDTLCFAGVYHIACFPQGKNPFVVTKKDFSTLGVRRIVKVTKVTLQLEATLNPENQALPFGRAEWYFEDETLNFVTENKEKITLYAEDCEGEMLVSCDIEGSASLQYRSISTGNPEVTFFIR